MIIRPSVAIGHNYNEMADLCRKSAEHSHGGSNECLTAKLSNLRSDVRNV